MKVKEIILSLIGILLISILLINLISKNSNKYIIYDGAMLAMTLTDAEGTVQNITEFPSETNYRVEVNCSNNAIGRWIADEWKLSIENIKDDVQCNVNFYELTNEDKLSNIVQTDNPESNNGYRYMGKNPNNFVWFNNELWRIIGLLPTCISASSGVCSETTYLVKIIRAYSIGGIAYDSLASGLHGKWGNNTLYQLLNNYYYGKLDGTSSSYCYGYSNTASVDCNYTKIGISSESNDYYGQMIEDVYWYIGSTTSDVMRYKAYENEIATVLTSTAKIGLMSASDYGYASGENGFGVTLDSYGTYAITGTNWLFLGYQWTMTQNSAAVTNVFRIPMGGSLTTISPNSLSCNVYPALYLDSNVYRISGEGTKLNPYVIGMQ